MLCNFRVAMDQADFDTERCVNAADIAKCRFAFDSAADRASALLDGTSFRAVALALGYRLTDSQIQVSSARSRPSTGEGVGMAGRHSALY